MKQRTIERILLILGQQLTDLVEQYFCSIAWHLFYLSVRQKVSGSPAHR